MGIIRRIGRRVKKGLGTIKQEAKHPGRPPGHKVSENPYWEETPAPAAPAAKGEDQSKEFWFLDGEDAEGWENTDAE